MLSSWITIKKPAQASLLYLLITFYQTVSLLCTPRQTSSPSIIKINIIVYVLLPCLTTTVCACVLSGSKKHTTGLNPPQSCVFPVKTMSCKNVTMFMNFSIQSSSLPSVLLLQICWWRLKLFNFNVKVDEKMINKSTIICLGSFLSLVPETKSYLKEQKGQSKEKNITIVLIHYIKTKYCSFVVFVVLDQVLLHFNT